MNFQKGCCIAIEQSMKTRLLTHIRFASYFKQEKRNGNSELNKLLLSVRRLVTGMKNDIKIHKTKIRTLTGNYQVTRSMNNYD
jgi:hypothetical protein